MKEKKYYVSVLPNGSVGKLNRAQLNEVRRADSRNRYYQTKSEEGIRKLHRMRGIMQ